MYDDDCELCRAGDPALPIGFLEFLRQHGTKDRHARHHEEIAAHLRWFTGVRLLDFLPLWPVGPTSFGVLVAPPGPGRDRHVLVTTGMSDLPMRPPERTGMDLCWAELAMSLPADWRFDRDEIVKERWRWPLALLAELAAYPHTEDAWVWDRHTLDFQAVYEGSGAFEGVFFGDDPGMPEEFRTIRLGGGKEVRILPVLPLFRAELDLARDHGPDELIRRLREKGVGPVHDPRRRPVAGSERCGPSGS